MSRRHAAAAPKPPRRMASDDSKGEDTCDKRAGVARSGSAGPPRRPSNDVILPAIFPRGVSPVHAAGSSARSSDAKSTENSGRRSASRGKSADSRHKHMMAGAEAAYGAPVQPKRPIRERSAKKQGESASHHTPHAPAEPDSDEFVVPRLNEVAVVNVSQTPVVASPQGVWHVQSAHNLRVDQLDFLHAPPLPVEGEPNQVGHHSRHGSADSDILHVKMPSLVLQAAALDSDVDLESGEVLRTEHTPTSYGLYKDHVRQAAVHGGSKIPMPKQFVRSLSAAHIPPPVVNESKLADDEQNGGEE
jgi:hypothetical protein